MLKQILSDKMVRALIVFAPATPVFLDIAERIEAELNREDFSVIIKPAAAATIPDIAASDLILFGSAKDDKTAVHTDFSEINRALAGINLAGRIAGLFALNSAETIEKFKSMLEDSEITVLKEALIFDSSISNEVIKNWTTQLISECKEGLDE